MSRADVEADIRETLGLVPSFMSAVPDGLIESEWASWKALELAETHIPNKYKELIGLAVSGATRCRYCAHFHAEAARLFGATEEEIAEGYTNRAIAARLVISEKTAGRHVENIYCKLGVHNRAGAVRVFAQMGRSPEVARGAAT